MHTLFGEAVLPLALKAARSRRRLDEALPLELIDDFTGDAGRHAQGVRHTHGRRQCEPVERLKGEVFDEAGREAELIQPVGRGG